jgi:hypothetical protein
MAAQTNGQPFKMGVRLVLNEQLSWTPTAEQNKPRIRLEYDSGFKSRREIAFAKSLTRLCSGGSRSCEL